MDLSPVPASRVEERGTLRRAVAVLDLLAADTAPPSVRAIAERTGLSKSAVQRILVELESVDLAVRDPATRRYGLGPRTLALGSAYQRGLSLHAAAIGPDDRPRRRGGRDGGPVRGARRPADPRRAGGARAPAQRTVPRRASAAAVVRRARRACCSPPAPPRRSSECSTTVSTPTSRR